MSLPQPPAQRAHVRLAGIRADISNRLWSVNAGMSSEAFNELMDQMAQLQLTFELRGFPAAGEVDTRSGPSERRGPSAARTGPRDRA